MDIGRIHRGDSKAQSDLHALDQRLDCYAYSFDLRVFRISVRKETSPMFYGDMPYDKRVYIHVAENDDPVYKFKTKASFEKEEVFEGYEFIGSFAIGDASSIQPDAVRDDRMYRHFLWPRHDKQAA